LPDGAEVGMACRTVGGEWFFLKSNALDRKLNEILTMDDDVHFFWSSEDPARINKINEYNFSSNKIIKYASVDGVNVVDGTIGFNPSGQIIAKSYNDEFRISIFTIVNIGGAISDTFSAFGTAGGNEFSFAILNSGKAYSSLRAQNNSTVYTGQLTIDLTSGWHYFYVEVTGTLSGSEMRFFQNGFQISSIISSNYGVRIGSGMQEIKNKVGSVCSTLYVRMTKHLSPEEQLFLFNKFKSENGIA